MEALLIIGGVVAAAVLPTYVVYYRNNVVPGRRREIEESLRQIDSERIARHHLAVFGLGSPEDGKESMDLILEHFDEFYSHVRYVLAGAVAWVPMTLGIAVMALWVDAKLTESGAAVGNIPVVLVAAFLGGYVWSLYELFNRGYSKNLTADSLFGIGYRVIASVPIGYAFSLVIVQEAAAFAAFAASAFPIRDLRLMVRRSFSQKLGQGAAPIPAGSGQEDYLRQRIQGLGSATIAQLEEIGISTTLDLAYADPIQLMVETGFPLRHVVDWIDQSLLAIYMRDKVPALRPRGIRGAIEASHFYRHHVADPQAHPPALREGYAQDEMVKNLAGVIEVPPAFLANVLYEIDGDPHVQLANLLWTSSKDDGGDADRQAGRSGKNETASSKKRAAKKPSRQ